MLEPATLDFASVSEIIYEPPIQLGAQQLVLAFDRARRGLKQTPSGMSAGFDDVHVDRAAIRAVPAGSTLTVTAMVGQRSNTRQFLEYVATATAPGASDGLVGGTAEIARAHGWALLISSEINLRPSLGHVSAENPR